MHCSANLKKKDCERAKFTFFDKAIGQKVTQAKQVPILIRYTLGKKKFEKKPDKEDLHLIKMINESDVPYWFPTNEIIKGEKTNELIRFSSVRLVFCIKIFFRQFFDVYKYNLIAAFPEFIPYCNADLS